MKNKDFIHRVQKKINRSGTIGAMYSLTPEPGTSGLEKTAPSGELEFRSISNKKNFSELLWFF